jgi:hypothetical protein
MELMKVTVEFDRADEIEVLDRVVERAAAMLAAEARESYTRIARETIEELRADVVEKRIGPLVDEALSDQAVGLPTMIMERVRFELAGRLPRRTDQLVREAMLKLAAGEEEARETASRKRWGRRRN